MGKRHVIRKKHSTMKNTPLIIILVCIAVVIGVIFLTKKETNSVTPSTSGDAEVLLTQLLDEGKPVFVFYHSTDCYTCKVMMATVADVFPEYEDSITLVDVNVYDPANQDLLRKAQIHSIPTQVFYDRKGESTIIIGVMEPEVFRQHLATLAGGN